MNLEKAIKSYLPMSETMFYILMSLVEPNHGYGIILHVEKITSGRMRIGAGTIYSSLTRLEKDNLIILHVEEARRKVYKINQLGLSILKAEIKRIEELFNNSKILKG